MALTTAQKSTLNRLLSQYPSISTRPTLLADMWEQLPSNPAVDALKAQWKSETTAKITAVKGSVDTVFDDGTGTIANA